MQKKLEKCCCKLKCYFLIGEYKLGETNRIIEIQYKIHMIKIYEHKRILNFLCLVTAG